MSNKDQNNELIDQVKKFAPQIVILLIAVAISYYIGSMKSQLKIYQERLAGTQPTSVNQQNPSANPNGEPTVITTLQKPTENDKIRGNKDAKYALVEYSDYDCPFCARFHETAKTFIDQNKDIMWVYRYFPLTQLHPDAEKKSEAAECVKQLGGIDAFWKFTDALYAEQTSVDKLAQVASEQAGVNSADFTKCLDSGQGKAAVDADIQSGTQAGVNGTPGNFILDIQTGEATVLRGAVPLETLNNTFKFVKGQ